jgi:large subunit ribosomal protein L23
MKDLHDVILKPVLSEKSYDLIEGKRYTFLVDPRSNKIEIKQAVEQVFGVEVESVTTSRKQGKMKRQGRTEGRRPETKKAYVTLKEGSQGIEFFESMQ